MLMLTKLSTDCCELIAETSNSIALNRQTFPIKATFNGTNELLALSFLLFALIRIQFFLILALILDNNGVIFPIVWILLFIDWMNAATIFPISMRVIHLSFACFQKTSSKFRYAISSTNIYIKCIELMIDALPSLGKIQCVTFNLI